MSITEASVTSHYLGPLALMGLLRIGKEASGKNDITHMEIAELKEINHHYMNVFMIRTYDDLLSGLKALVTTCINSDPLAPLAKTNFSGILGSGKDTLEV